MTEIDDEFIRLKRLYEAGRPSEEFTRMYDFVPLNETAIAADRRAENETESAYADLKNELAILEADERQDGDFVILWTQPKYSEPIGRIWRDFQILQYRDPVAYKSVLMENPKLTHRVQLIMYYVIRKSTNAAARAKLQDGLGNSQKTLEKSITDLPSNIQDEMRSYKMSQVLEALRWLIGHLEANHEKIAG